MEIVSSAIRVSTTDLRRLLCSLAAQKLPVGLRYQMKGEQWYPNFLRVMEVEPGDSLLLHDQTRRKLLTLPDLTRIFQFELNARLHVYQPNCQYRVVQHDPPMLK